MTDKDKELELNIRFLAKYCKEEYNDVKVDAVLLGALDLINRQQAKIEALQMDNKQLESDVINANMNGEHLLADNKRLLTELLRLKEEIAQPYLLINCDDKSVEVLIERLKNQKVISVPDNESTVEFLDKASIRAEAVKEFAERLKKECIIDRGYEILQEGTIDDFLKEMAGDTE